MRADCHMHTCFSVDSDARPEEMIKEAVKKGLEVICFTDHQDKDVVVKGQEWIFDSEKYFRELGRLREAYAAQICVRIGVEIGLQPHLGEYFRNYTHAYPFDFVIGSVHVIDSMDPYYPEFFDGRSDAEAYRRTFEETLTDIQAVEDYDVLGHLDYVVRYGRKKEQEYSYQKFADQIDEILKYLIEHGKGLELNTAGLKYGLPFAHPQMDALKRYRELGGEIITVGADAHRPEHIAYDFQKVNAILEECGFKYYTEFENRRPVFKKI